MRCTCVARESGERSRNCTEIHIFNAADFGMYRGSGSQGYSRAVVNTRHIFSSFFLHTFIMIVAIRAEISHAATPASGLCFAQFPAFGKPPALWPGPGRRRIEVRGTTLPILAASGRARTSARLFPAGAVPCGPWLSSARTRFSRAEDMCLSMSSVQVETDDTEAPIILERDPITGEKRAGGPGLEAGDFGGQCTVFDLEAPFKATGDQPEAIEEIVKRLRLPTPPPVRRCIPGPCTLKSVFVSAAVNLRFARLYGE